MSRLPDDTRIGRLLRERAETRRREAARRALAALDALEGAGVPAVVVGSLARGRFLGHSDVDLFVEDRHGLAPEAIIAIIERAMGDFPFDVLFADRVSDTDRPFILERTLCATDLRPPHASA